MGVAKMISTNQSNNIWRSVIEKIWQSMELHTMIVTAVDELLTQLQLERCSFVWYSPDTDRVEVVCDRIREPMDALQSEIASEVTSGDDLFKQLEAFVPAIAAGKLLVNHDNSAQSDRTDSHHWKTINQTQLCTKSNQSFLLVPVKRQAKRGYISCWDTLSRTWSSTDIEFVQLIAQQLEIAIHQTHLYQHLKKQAKREKLVNKITQRTRQSFDLRIISNEAISQLLKALKVDRCIIHLVEENDKNSSHPGDLEAEMAFRRSHLLEVCRDPYPVTIDEFDTHGPITQWVIEHRQPVSIPDISQDPRIGGQNSEYARAQIKSSLVMPVHTQGKLHAILYLNQCDRQRDWSKQDRELAEAVADQLAISIQQAKLYEQVHTAMKVQEHKAEELKNALEQLKKAQSKLIQSEKMSSLGQMVAGIAHEINNPVNFIYGNLSHVDCYTKDLMGLLELYQQQDPNPGSEISEYIEEIDLTFLQEDLWKMLGSMKMGADRIRDIVLSLRNFSRLDEADIKQVDIHEGIESTLLILKNRLKGKPGYPSIEVVKKYGKLPKVECYVGQLNQVFMNLIANAIDALEESHQVRAREQMCPQPNQIVIQTELLGNPTRPNSQSVLIKIKDNGLGIKPEIKSQLFDPFFTTKPVGKGTGMGLSISYQIIVQKHHGNLKCISSPGDGAEFRIKIPLSQTPKSLAMMS